MARKRPNDSGRRDSRGRRVMVSGESAEARSDAPLPAADDTQVDAMLMSLAEPDAGDLDGLRDQLVAHPDSTVRAIYAMSPACGDHLDTLAEDTDSVVRSTVAQRWDHPLPERLLDDPDPVVSIAVARRLDISDDDRARIMGRPDVARVANIIMV